MPKGLENCESMEFYHHGFEKGIGYQWRSKAWGKSPEAVFL